MDELSLTSRIIMYVLLTVMLLYCIAVAMWQYRVWGGNALKNADGSTDDWHRQQTHYGIAVADLFVACPLVLAGILLVFFAPRWGFYLLALVAFWLVWANTMTTATSLRFEHPKIDIRWFVAFPSGGLLGLAYLMWSFVNFDAIY